MLLNISRVNKENGMAEHVARMGELRNANKMLVEKLTNRPTNTLAQEPNVHHRVHKSPPLSLS
jgi:hypothetical protein